MDSADLEAYADVFAALADESRLELLTTVCRECHPEGPVRFSEAMAATEFEDSGRFSYHLDRLRENFLYSREGAYLPTTAAWEVYVAMRTGRLAPNDLDRRRASLDAACLGCGRPLVAEYQYELSVWCPDCERVHWSAPVGPDVAGDAELASLARELERADRAGTRAQLEHRCPRCGGESRAWFRDEPRPHRPTDLVATTGCANCGHWIRHRSVGSLLLVLPAVQDYCDEHDVDLDERPLWGYHWTRAGTGTTVESTEPWRVEQYAHVDGVRLRVVLESGGTVASIDHVPIGRRPD